MEYHIKGNYYFDIDSSNQLRITGPENHLLLGLGVPKQHPLTIEHYDLDEDRLTLEIRIPTSSITVPMPLVTDIRSLRHHVEPVKPRPTYQELINEGILELLPRDKKKLSITGSTRISLTNSYQDSRGTENTYGAELIFPPEYEVELEQNSISITSSTEEIEILIQTISTVELEEKITSTFFSEPIELDPELFSPQIIELYKESQQNIEHLVINNKTSSFEYGTIFPRDWIESADLGEHDMSQEIIDYMYSQSMKYVSESGEGWHEEIIGEYRTKLGEEAQFIDRKMIDIEPHYLLGVPRVSRRFLFDEENHDKFNRIASYVVKQAKNHRLITFKQIDPEEESYYPVGNWRDSASAFPGQKSPLAPYDVNCVFYPQALKIIKKYHDYFDTIELEELDELIEKWDHHKVKYRLYHPNDIIGYSLALHGRKNIPMPFAHLDESYDLYYSFPTREEIISFSKKVIDPDFFYTPAGPLLVAADEPAFTTRQYHGKVIWPKQAGFAVAGLAKHFRIGQQEDWPKPILNIIRNAIIITAEACFRGWKDINSVPELYYYDEKTDKARLFIDQEAYEGQMSLIQLWSSVSCRRIVQEYQYVIDHPIEIEQAPTD